MLNDRDLKLDLVAVGTLALTAFLAASLLSYSPADPPTTLVYPEPTTTVNMCGRWGALASSLLLNAFGVGAYYLVISLAVLAGMLISRRELNDWLTRFIGWLLSFLGVTTLAAMALPGFSPGPVIGPGGYLGAAGKGLLEMNFASVGAYILLISFVLGGLLLSTDYIVVRILAWTVGTPIRHMGRGILKVGGAYAAKLEQQQADADESAATGKKPKVKRMRTDLDAPATVETKTEGEPTIRFNNRPAAAPAAQEAAKPDAETPAKPEEAEKKPEEEKNESAVKIRGPRRNQRDAMIAEIEEASNKTEPAEYELPGIDLLTAGEPICFDEQEKDVRRKAKILEKTFADFGFNIRVVEIQTGPVIAQFEVELEAGLRLSRITGLADDLAIALRVPSVRIVAPIPGKNTVGIEVPNAERQLVRMREVIEETSEKVRSMRIPVFLGKDVSGNSMVVDLSSMPHLLIAGRTGTGKSVCLNSIIVSMLYTRRPEEVRMLLIDPKMVELSLYKNIPHLMHPVVTDMRKAEAILGWAVEKMEERYALLARAGVRHLASYNQLGEEELMERMQPVDDEERKSIPRTMPYIVIVADEMADLMMTAAKEVEGHIIRLAQKSRAVGIHLVLATQKPTVDVITGLIKSNLPARICFEVSSRTDSRVVLDEMGADKLLGHGDMLFLRPGSSALIRGQGTYLSDEETVRVIGAVATNEPQFVNELMGLKTKDEVNGEGGPVLKHRDDLYEAAVDIVVRERRGSVSLLQRGLGIGYGRAARLIDFMAEDELIGPYNGSQARDVLITVEEWETMRSNSAEGGTPKRSNKITLATPRPDLVEEEQAVVRDPGERDNPPPKPSRPPAARKVEPEVAEEVEDEEPADEEAEYDEESYDEYEEDDGEQWAESA